MLPLTTNDKSYMENLAVPSDLSLKSCSRSLIFETLYLKGNTVITAEVMILKSNFPEGAGDTEASMVTSTAYKHLLWRPKFLSVSF